MGKPGRSDMVAGVTAGAALFICCGAPLLIAAVVTAAASAGLVAQGAVLIGAAGLGLAAVLGVRYMRRRSAAARADEACAECEPGPERHHHERTVEGRPA